MLSNQTKNELFAANISHQSRVLVNGIIGFTEILMDEKLTKQQKEYLGIIHNATDKLWALMNDVLGFSEIEANLFDSDSLGFDVNTLLESVSYQKKPNNTSSKKTLSGSVLVAEDTRSNQLLVKLLLEKLGLKVFTAEDGQLAVEKAQKESFDLILMDIEMPKLNGYEATKRLRENGIKTPIIAVTGHAMKADKEKCIKAGCDDYLAKPINHIKLQDIITKYMCNSNKKQESCIQGVSVD